MSLNLLKIEALSNDFRSTYGYDNYQSLDLYNLLPSLKVLTVFKPLNDTIAGAASKIENFYFILINSNDTIGRQNFTICHELYHLFIQKEFSAKLETKIGSYNKDDINEYYADIFSSFLLLPTDGLLKLIPEKELRTDKISIQTLFSIEQYFKCSHSALLHRLRLLKIISNDFLISSNSAVKSQAKMYSVDCTLYEPGNHNRVIGDYSPLSYQLLNNNVISETYFLNLMYDLGIKPEELYDFNETI